MLVHYSVQQSSFLLTAEVLDVLTANC